MGAQRPPGEARQAANPEAAHTAAPAAAVAAAAAAAAAAAGCLAAQAMRSRLLNHHCCAFHGEMACCCWRLRVLQAKRPRVARAIPVCMPQVSCLPRAARGRRGCSRCVQRCPCPCLGAGRPQPPPPEGRTRGRGDQKGCIRGTRRANSVCAEPPGRARALLALASGSMAWHPGGAMWRGAELCTGTRSNCS